LESAASLTSALVFFLIAFFPIGVWGFFFLARTASRLHQAMLADNQTGLL